MTGVQTCALPIFTHNWYFKKLLVGVPPTDGATYTGKRSRFSAVKVRGEKGRKVRRMMRRERAQGQEDDEEPEV